MGSRRARMIRATAFFLLLLQAASTHQASVPTDANLVLTAAAESLESVLGLDYNVLEPTFRDIDLVKENLVELMPYLEESERPSSPRPMPTFWTLKGLSQWILEQPLVSLLTRPLGTVSKCRARSLDIQRNSNPV